MNQVLIAYESPYGYTTQIANFIKDKLEEYELETVVIDVIRSKNKEIYPLAQYKGIILGTSTKISAFKKLKKTFFKKDLAQYKDDSHYVAVFTNSPSNLEMLVEPDDKYMQYIIKKLGFIPDLCEVFNPVLDFTPFSPLTSDNIDLYRIICKKKLIQNGIEVDLNGVNDFRDWKSIEEFADNFSALLVDIN